MKTWEMIKELTENPAKKFTYNGGANGAYVTVEDGLFVWRGNFQNGQEMSIGYIDERGRDWTEIKQPVTWQEALEAWAKRTNGVTCIVNDKKFFYQYDKITPLVKEHIIYGTWYIGEV